METRKFFNQSALNLLLLRTFGGWDNKVSYEPTLKGFSEEKCKWFKSVIINDDDFEEVYVNGVSDCGLLRGITIFWEQELIELHYIDHDSQESIIEYLPLDGIYQMIFKEKIKPPETDHHGNDDDE